VIDRHDYAYPFAIGPSGQANQAAYEAHVAQMIRQILLTTPGERVDLPDFGCGLRRIVFASHDPSLDSTTQMLVQQALKRWLGDQIDVRRVRVLPPEETADEGEFAISIEYLVRETQRTDEAKVEVL
jgi:phage baseplate assembly protein W